MRALRVQPCCSDIRSSLRSTLGASLIVVICFGEAIV
jgi:hypothetical protein